MINDFVKKEDLIMFTSGARFTMGGVYLKEGKKDLMATFDLLIRELPENRNYFVFAGLEHIADYLLNLKFTKEQLQYLKKTFQFDSEILNYYQKFRFTGDLYALPEGTISFPNEPLIRITAPIIEAQLIEQYVVNTIMLQTMLASKLARVMSILNKKQKQFGLTFVRSHGIDAAMKAVRVSKIVGAQLVGLPLASMKYKIYKPEGGATCHHLFSAFPDELSAFRAYTKHFGPRGLLLVDTYDTVQGIKNFITVAKEMEEKGVKLRALFLDSGDLYKLSVLARKMLDQAGLNYIQIMACSNMEEYKIKELEEKGAPIDIYAAGTEVSTVSDAPKLEVVYKLSEIQEGKKKIPKMKLSTKKVSLPGRKQVFRVTQRGKYQYDIIGLENEKINNSQKLLRPVIKNGKLVKKSPKMEEVHKHYIKETKKFNPRLFDINRKFNYPVKISPRLKSLMKKTEKEIKKVHHL